MLLLGSMFVFLEEAIVFPIAIYLSKVRRHSRVACFYCRWLGLESGNCCRQDSSLCFIKIQVHLVIPKECVCEQKKSAMAKKNVLIFRAANCSVNTFFSTKKEKQWIGFLWRREFWFPMKKVEMKSSSVCKKKSIVDHRILSLLKRGLELKENRKGRQRGRQR